MTNNFLLLNSDKTEVMVVGPKHLGGQLVLHGLSLSTNPSVKDLGVMIYQDIYLNTHLKHISKTSFFPRRNIAKVKKVLP